MAIMKKNILLVEDDESLRSGLLLLLENAEHTVESAPDGKAALHILQHKKFDVIILDDNLPFIQGSDLLGLIRIRNPGVKIIIMSGLFNAEGIKKIREQGADITIEKPFDLDVLLSHLQ
jgi:DNA-binding response OmpR family regulator